ncbi:MAG TPA: hypothetical protein VKY19_24130 [Ktedonosporobacter sp.]|jgi:hypothetical protein|nr:hypothetical protein [Ktedonosporobacter sp.]
MWKTSVQAGRYGSFKRLEQCVQLGHIAVDERGKLVDGVNKTPEAVEEVLSLLLWACYLILIKKGGYTYPLSKRPYVAMIAEQEAIGSWFG